MSPDGVILYLGNYITEDGVIAYILDNLKRRKDASVRFVPVIKDGKTTWKDKYAMTDEEALKRNQDNRKYKVVSLESKRNEIGKSLFEAEMMNNPAKVGDSVFDRGIIDNLEKNCYEYKDIDAVIPVHLCGVRAKTDYGNVKVIEDSAHLIEEGQCRGTENSVCFSFYATKNMTMGEGGAICTNDDKAAEWFKQARHHGISKGGWNRYKEGGSWRYDIEFIGWKFNPSDTLAAVGSVNLKKMKKIDKERRRVVNLYNKELGYDNFGLHLYPVLVNDRAKFMTLMQEAGIQCSVHFLPIHQMTAFKGLNNKELKNTEWLGERLVSLPLFPFLKNNEIKKICKKVKETKLLLPSSD